MESKEANKVKIEVELVNNGAVLDYTELGLKFVTKAENLADDLGRDIIAEMDALGCSKFRIEINVSPI